MDKLLTSRQTPYWMLIASLVSAFVLARVVAQGMFVDGLIYADLSRNLAEGVGDAWRLQFSETLFPVFSEHPPLAIWLQSVAFTTFGDSIYVEKFYSLATLVITAVLIAMTWRRLVPRLAHISWLPVVIWLVVQKIAWAYSNNFLENTQTIFVIVAILLVIITCENRLSQKYGFLYSLNLNVLAGLFVSAAALTKGPTGLFPLVGFGSYWLATRSIGFGFALTSTAIMFATVAVFFGGLWLVPDARDFLQRYLDLQVMASISGQRGGTGWFNNLEIFLRAIAVPTGLAVIILTAGKLRRLNSMRIEVGKALFLAIVFLAGSLPIFVSPRIYVHYFNPSIPFLALSYAVIVGPIIAQFEHSNTEISRRYLFLVSAVVLVGSLGYALSRWGADGRDRQLLPEIRLVASLLQLKSPADHWFTVPICPDDWQLWDLHAYMARYYKVSLKKVEKSDAYLLASQNCSYKNLSDFKNISPNNTRVGLYARRDMKD